VTVNSESTQTVTIESDAAGMHTAIQGFIEKYNALQDLIESHTKVEVSGTTVTGGLLANNHEVEAWAKQLRSLAFAPVSGVAGSISRLDDLGIDFDGITGHLAIKNADKLSSALASNPDDLKAFFIDGPNSFVNKMYDLATVTKSWNAAAQETLAKASTNIDKQITQLQARLVSQRELLTNSFLNMLDAQSKASNMSTYLTNHYFKSSS
jgi:flagellar hook-associated protein 2